jgi:hypothetical protein
VLEVVLEVMLVVALGDVLDLSWSISVVVTALL